MREIRVSRRIKNKVQEVIIIVALIVCAVLCRHYAILLGDNSLSIVLSDIRSLIFIGLFTAWGIAAERRIMQRQVRIYLVSIAVLMVFWMVVRTFKFMLFDPLDIIRALWYMYYIPMLLLPALSVLIALSLGKCENYSLSKWGKLLLVSTIMMILVVLTNDYHQLVFIFKGEHWIDAEYSYGWGYYIIAIWIILCVSFALAIMIKKCRVPNSRTFLFLPLIPFGVMVIYGIMYIAEVPHLMDIAGDMTVVFCLFFAITLECCIQCGLIMSNRGYYDLIKISSTKVNITDSDYNVYYASDDEIVATKNELALTKHKNVEMPSGKILCGMPIRGGNVIWETDATATIALRERLKIISKSLLEERVLLEAEIELKENQVITDTRNRLYDNIAMDLFKQFEQIENISKEETHIKENKDMVLKQLCVLGAYIKRRCNLLIINEEHNNISFTELVYCLRESADYIRLYGADCNISVNGERMVPIQCVKVAYDFFQEIVEKTLIKLTALLVRCEVSQDNIIIKLQAECTSEAEIIKGLNMEEKIRELSGSFNLEYYDEVLYAGLKLPLNGGEE